MEMDGWVSKLSFLSLAMRSFMFLPSYEDIESE
jgi:hypothetical protein